MDLAGYVINAVLVEGRSVKEVCESHDRFLAQIGLGGLPFAETARSTELLDTEVLPVVRRETSGQTKQVA